MPLVPGTRLGPYEILAPLGAGGMGEVYRAKDTRLDRSVAIKVLPSHLTGDPERRARFEREAKAVSSLNHPHICTVHDVGHEQGTDYLVMELLQGETLAERLRKGPLPLDQMLRTAIEIADALDKAHRQGVIHRDLKPGNVMLTKAGSKLMDFGLAKRATAKASSLEPVLSSAPTEMPPEDERPLTAEGSLLGTFQYMSPEQLEGKEADARSDLWAFGCVLYEMATGKRAFEGKSQASLIGAILKDEPQPITQLQPLTPPALERLVKVCLAKDPDDRLQTAHDVMQELKWIAEAPAGGAAAAGTAATATGTTGGWLRGATQGQRRLALVVSVVALLAAAVLGGLVGRGTMQGRGSSAAVGEPVITHILPPPDSVSAFRDGFAVSPDGRKVVFSSLSSKGERLLWIRSLDKTVPQPLLDTAGAHLPFWSPDGKDIAFFTLGKLKRVRAEGGSSQVIPGHRALRGYGGSWGPDGSILAAHDDGGILRVDAAGGQAVSVFSSKQGGWRPFWLPDGKRFLYDRNGELFVGPPVEGRPRTAIGGVVGASHVEFVAPDRLVFWEISTRALSTQRVDLERGSVLGQRQVLVEDVPRPWDTPAFSVSPAGALAYVESLPETRNEYAHRMQWVDRGGRVLGNVGEVGGYWYARLSHDGRRIATHPDEDIWIYDAETGIPTRFTTGFSGWGPVWSRTGDRIAHGEETRDGDRIVERPSSGGEARALAPIETNDWASDWSPDGRYLALTHRIWSFPDLVMLDVSEQRMIPFLATDYNEMNAVFSPDGRHVAYQSDETGAFEVYVRPFPGPGPARRVSQAGGQHPRWRGDGKELFFLTADWTVMATPVSTRPAFEHVSPVPLFRMPMADIGRGLVSPYDVAPDGKRFLVIVRQPTPIPLTLTFVQNWTALLDR